jgi:hypothetical protein
VGLDQYLSARKYVSGSEYTDEQSRAQFDEIVGALKAERIVGGLAFPSATIEVSVAYWRKANQVHGWFVSNCADGEDNCQQVYVTREQLTELLNTCRQVKEGGREVALELLPPTSGFFFGSYDIDEWYWQDIDDTIEQLERVLSETPESEWDFIYQASW